MFRLIDAVERRPQAAFAAFLVLHAVVWTALPAILYLNLPLDLIEALTYGREWQLGYDKLPPLPWWLVEIVYRVFGVDTAYYALAQAVVVIAFVLVWKTARPLVGALGALVAILIIDGMHYFNFTAAKFNHDVIQLPFWALAGFAFHAGLRRGGIGYWALLGAALGCALWAKYFVAVLVAPLVLFMLLDREARRRLASPGPWVAAAVALAHHGAASRLAGAERFPAVPLCRGPGPAGARAVRSSAASVPVPGRTIFLHPSGAGDRRAAILAAKQK